MSGSRIVDHFQSTAPNSGRNQHLFSGVLRGQLVFHEIASLIMQNLARVFSSNYIYSVEKIKHLCANYLNLRNSTKIHKFF